MHVNRATLWCALWSGDVNGPFFFENAAGEASTVNCDRYYRMVIKSCLTISDLGGS